MKVLFLQLNKGLAGHELLAQRELSVAPAVGDVVVVRGSDGVRVQLTVQHVKWFVDEGVVWAFYRHSTPVGDSYEADEMALITPWRDPFLSKKAPVALDVV